MSPQIISSSDLNLSSDVSVLIGVFFIDMKHDKKWKDNTIVTAEVMLRQTTFRGAMLDARRRKTSDHVALMEEENQANTLSRMKRNEYPVHVQHKDIMKKICRADQSLWWRSKSCHGCDKYASIET